MAAPDFTFNSSNRYKVTITRDTNNYDVKYDRGGTTIDASLQGVTSLPNGFINVYTLQIIPNPGEIIIAGDFTIDGAPGIAASNLVDAATHVAQTPPYLGPEPSLHGISPNVPHFMGGDGTAVPSNVAANAASTPWVFPGYTGQVAFQRYEWTTGPWGLTPSPHMRIFYPGQIYSLTMTEIYEDDDGNEWHAGKPYTSVTLNTMPIKLHVKLVPDGSLWLSGSNMILTYPNKHIEIKLDIDEHTTTPVLRYECDLNGTCFPSYSTGPNTYTTMALCNVACVGTQVCDWVLDKDVTIYPLDAASLVGNTWPTGSMGGSLYSDDSTLVPYVGYDDTLWAVDTQQSYILVHTTPNLVYPIDQYDCEDFVSSNVTTSLSTSNPLEAYIEWTLTPEFVYDDVNFVNQNIIGSNLRILGMFPDNTKPDGTTIPLASHGYGREINYYHSDTPGWSTGNTAYNYIRTHEVYDSNSQNPYPVSIVIRVYLNFTFPATPTSGTVNIDLGRIEVNPPF